MVFNDKAYALSVWTLDRIAACESTWNRSRETSWEELAPLIPDENENVLDVGCGIGFYYRLLVPQKAREYVGIDITDNMIKRAKELHPSGDFRVASIFNLPFKEKSFDLLFCWDVLIHLPCEMIGTLISKLCFVSRRYVVFNLYIVQEESTRVLDAGEYLTYMSDRRMKEIFSNLTDFSLVSESKPESTHIYLLQRNGE